MLERERAGMGDWRPRGRSLVHMFDRGRVVGGGVVGVGLVGMKIVRRPDRKR